MKNKHFQIHYFTFMVFVFCCFIQSTQAVQSVAEETNIYFIGELFEWQEFVHHDRFLKETGPRFGIGLNHDVQFYNDHLIFKPRIEIIGGRVDYEGSTQSHIPLESDTDYYDGKVGFDLGWRYTSLKKYSIEPFVGAGLRGWYRKIHDAAASDKITQAKGYPEEWRSAYFRVGLRGDLALAEKTLLFVEVGSTFPVYNQNKARFDESDLGPDVTFTPGNQPSWFAEAGVQYTPFRAGIYYDSLRFSKSDNEHSRGTIYYQPRTEADMYGIRVGIIF